MRSARHANIGCPGGGKRRAGRTSCVWLLLVIGCFLLVAGFGSSGPIQDDYDYFPMRTLTMPDIKNFAAVIAPLQDFAREKGGRFRVSSPAGQPSSILFNIDGQHYSISGGDRLKASGLEFFIYWRDDAANERALDDLAEQLRQRLAEFGSVTVTAAPPGTRPRKESTNTWRKRP